MEALHSSETSVLTRGTWHNIPEDSIFIVTAVETSYLTTNSFAVILIYDYANKINSNRNTAYLTVLMSDCTMHMKIMP
jgi:hypothetical protein